MRIVVAALLVWFAGCGGGGSGWKLADATPKQAVESYANAFLHGTEADYVSMWSTTCARPKSMSSSGWSSFRHRVGRALGRSVADVRVTGAAVQDETSTKASASATYDLPVAKAGNDNWIPFVREGAHWRVANCTLLPIGGQGG